MIPGRRASPEDAERDRPDHLLAVHNRVPAGGGVLQPFGHYSGASVSVVILVALLVCIPTTIGALLSAIGIAGMDRLVQRNVLAMSGRAVEAAGTSRPSSWTRPAPSHSATAWRRTSSPSAATPSRRWPMWPNWPPWPTRRRRDGPSWSWPRSASASASGSSRAPQVRGLHRPDPHVGTRLRGRRSARGRPIGPAVVGRAGRDLPDDLGDIVEQISRAGSTPLVVSDGPAILGVIELKDVVKTGIRRSSMRCVRWGSGRS